MSLLKRKQEKTGTVSVRVPLSVKEQIDTLRKLADSKGFDLTASLTDALVKWTKQAQEELGIVTPPTPQIVTKSQLANGSDPQRA
jgi:hypothetical protein